MIWMPCSARCLKGVAGGFRTHCCVPQTSISFQATQEELEVVSILTYRTPLLELGAQESVCPSTV